MSEQTIQIVIAEDDFLVSEEIKYVLEDSGYEIVGEACNGEEAVEMVSELKPDLILMDIKMPKKDGLEAAREITEQYPIPIVILTAYESTELVEEASKVGVGAFIGKPPKLTEIDRAIRIALARHNDLMEMQLLTSELENKNKELSKALAENKVLRGILPICSFCKNIRDDEGHWHQVETYIHQRTKADFSHSVCPVCMKKYYPEV